jgi:hypothetical protein
MSPQVRAAGTFTRSFLERSPLGRRRRPLGPFQIFGVGLFSVDSGGECLHEPAHLTDHGSRLVAVERLARVHNLIAEHILERAELHQRAVIEVELRFAGERLREGENLVLRFLQLCDVEFPGFSGDPLDAA